MLACCLWVLDMNEVNVQTMTDIWKYLNLIEATLNLKLQQIHLPTNTYFFLYKNSFSTLLQDHRRVLCSNFMKILIILDVNLVSQICFKIGIYVLYTLLNNVYQFHEDWTNTSGRSVVYMF